MKEISYNKDNEYNEGVFAAKKENDYMFLTTSKFKFLDVKTTLDLSQVIMLGASQWLAQCKSQCFHTNGWMATKIKSCKSSQL